MLDKLSFNSFRQDDDLICDPVLCKINDQADSWKTGEIMGVAVTHKERTSLTPLTNVLPSPEFLTHF